MIVHRRADQRFHSDFDWLDSWHTFTFGHHQDPVWNGFRALRVINDDTVAPGMGFGTHGHRDMEIVSYVLSGALEHRDSLGNGSVIRPGDVQRMSAGTGVRHSEFNASKTEPVHFLQIWILPSKAGFPAGYEQKAFPALTAASSGGFHLVASGDGREGSVTIHQDAAIHAARLAAGEAAALPLSAGRHGWLHVARGAVAVGALTLGAGAGLGVRDEAALTATATEDAELLWFDLG